jgi:hypothetical protein
MSMFLWVNVHLLFENVDSTSKEIYWRVSLVCTTKEKIKAVFLILVLFFIYPASLKIASKCKRYYFQVPRFFVSEDFLWPQNLKEFKKIHISSYFNFTEYLESDGHHCTICDIYLDTEQELAEHCGTVHKMKLRISCDFCSGRNTIKLGYNEQLETGHSF